MTSVGPTRLTPGPDSYDQDLLAIAPKPDTILGLTGNDSILSSTLGGSQVEGNEDNDFLTSRGPNDTIFGGTGNDSLTARSTETRLIGDDGRDTLSSDFAATLYGGAGTDLVLGSSGSNILFGNQDNDQIYGGVQGADSLYGGKDNDTLGFLNPGGGNNIDGNAINVGTGNPGQNFVAGNLGNDLIVGIGAGDSLYGGQEDDTIVARGSGSFASGDLGDDDLTVSNPTTTSIISGTNPQVVGLFRVTLSGGDGDDELTGGIGDFNEGGQNLLDGGAGDDVITGRASQDSLLGGAGDDFITTESVTGLLVSPGVSSDAVAAVLFGDNILDGGDGNDTLLAGSQNDQMLGGAGDDSLAGPFTAMDGGAGDDTLAGNLFTLAGATAEVEVTLSGGDGDDLIQGAFVAAGGTLINILDGGLGNDTLILNTTNDELVGVLDGNDSIVAGGLAPTGVFEILDTLGNNTLVGSNGDDSLRTGDGADFIQGGTVVETSGTIPGILESIGAGDDTLISGGGDDYLFGGTGADFLIGEAGDDTLQGGYNSVEGGDVLTGGEGSDRFFYQFAGEVQGAVTQAQASLADLITDFEDGTDEIAFSRTGFGFDGSGSELSDEQFVLVGTGFYNDAAAGTFPGELLAYERQTGFLLYDSNGAGAGGIFVVARFEQDGNSFPIITENDITII
ncbi:MAG: calcium-binding protein [Oscillatoriales cyanobacterium SM2_3_0]|nr:calcium-binding protein [Oscillatoriales cyanobacterium SM2_3_0]